MTIDLGGHTLTVEGPVHECEALVRILCALSLEAPGGTVQHGTIRGAGVMGRAQTTLRGVSLVDADVVLAQPGPPGVASRLHSSTIVDSSVILMGSSHDVRGNVVVRGAISTYHQPRAMYDVVIERNLILAGDESRHGISAAVYPYVAGDMTGRISENVVAGATISGIRIGSYLQYVGAMEISRNLVARNVGHGIEIVGERHPAPYAGGPVTVAGNVALANGGAGIHAPWVPGVPHRSGRRRRERGRRERREAPVHRRRVCAAVGPPLIPSTPAATPAVDAARSWEEEVVAPTVRRRRLGGADDRGDET